MLDGLRGIAILLVLACHIPPPSGSSESLLAGGFLGVDIFFVLSGFLISSILVAEWKSTGTIILSRFYLRRFARLAPALIVMLIGVNLGAAGASFGAEELTNLRWATAAGISYVANFRFASCANLSMLGHLWTLSIEEQFYLVIPLLLFVLLQKKFSFRLILSLLLGSFVISGAWRFYILSHYEQSLCTILRILAGPDTRCGGLLVGTALGYFFQTRGARTFQTPLWRLAGTLGAAFIGCAAASSHFYDRIIYGGVLDLIWIAAAALIASSVANPDSLLSNLLSLSPLRWIGKISYGLYLWHFPVAYCTLHGMDQPLKAGLLIVGLSFGIAALSYYLIEQPARRFFKAYEKGRYAEAQTQSGSA